jgi:hypothetical protein
MAECPLQYDLNASDFRVNNRGVGGDYIVTLPLIPYKGLVLSSKMELAESGVIRQVLFKGRDSEKISPSRIL